MKTLRLGASIQQNDINVKLRQAQKFLEKGLQVRIEVVLKGRENLRPELGQDLLKRFVSSLSEFGTLANVPSLKGNVIGATMNPIGRKG